MTDRGPGISEAFSSRAFERYSHVNLSGKSSLFGSGLGLSIAKPVMEILGGAIGFDLVPDGEIAFHFDLPDAEARRAIRLD